MNDPRYPIGKFHYEGMQSADDRLRGIGILTETPARFRAALEGLSETQLDTPYRDGGWTLRQLAHHLPDSHLNAYVRFKLALTEDAPLVKPYDEARWAELPDNQITPVETSLVLLESLHERWVDLLHAMSDADFARTYRHPQIDGPRTLDYLLAIYVWHGPHHTAHVTELRRRIGW